MKVFLWQGGMDKNVPEAMGRYLAQRIPDCEARFYPNEGHVSIAVKHANEILRAMTQDFDSV